MAIGMPTSGALAKQRGNQKGIHREMSVPYGGSESYMAIHPHFAGAWEEDEERS